MSAQAVVAHYLTEVVADLEIELRKQDKDIEPATDPGNPPPLPEKLCIPPWVCVMPVDELYRYANELRQYVDGVFRRTSELAAAAREKGVKEIPYRVVDSPERPMM